METLEMSWRAVRLGGCVMLLFHVRLSVSAFESCVPADPQQL